MAFTKRLNEGWTLTDGVFPPFLLDSPTDVLTSLERQGLIVKSPAGISILHQEWVRMRNYTYALRFELPEEEAELYALYFPCVLGSGHMTVNGEMAALPCCGGSYTLLNQYLKSGENTVEVMFHAPEAGETAGIIGDVFLRAMSDLSITKAHFIASGSEIESAFEVEVLSKGKYICKYTVSLDGEFVQSYEFIERMNAATTLSLNHKLKLSDPVRYNPQQPLETSYQVRLVIERMGIGCDQVFQDVCFCDAPTRAAKAHPSLIYDNEQRERTFQTLREMGADSVVFDELNALYPISSIAHGLIPISGEGFTPFSAENALAAQTTIKSIAGDMEFWPPDRLVYKFLRSPEFDQQAFESLFGLNACGDWSRCIRLSQRLQAERLFRDAMELRISNTPAMIEAPLGVHPSLIGTALVEFNGTQHPGYDALENAWAQVCAYVRLPESLSANARDALSLDCFLINAATPRPFKVNITVKADAIKVAEKEFTAENCGITSLGKLEIAAPESSCTLIISCEVVSVGTLLWRHDSHISIVKPGQAPLTPFMNFFVN